jgi:queuine/archaeosine tRNA-ribosyltransferase
MEQIRAALKEDRFLEFKDAFLNKKDEIIKNSDKE